MVKYGKQFPTGTSSLDAELWCLRHDKRKDYEGGRLSSFDHYKKAVDIVFNNRESIRTHVWHEWNVRMVTEMLGGREDKRFVGIAGASSSGKSDEAGLFAIMMYLSAPTETLCLLTSTTLELAKLRIWKAVREYWNQVEYYFEQRRMRCPGKAVHSKCAIRGFDAKLEYSDTSGLRLVAADKQKGEEATSKVIGAKAPGPGLLLLAADELPELSPNLLTYSYTNLINNPKFWMIALGNPNLKMDPFGKFCEPADGWDSVAHEPDEWLTHRGKVIRLDGERNPRIMEEANWSEKDKRSKTAKCFWMPSQDVVEGVKNRFGAKSRFYYRMYRAMWSSDKAPNAIYSESELLRASVGDEPKWDNPNSLVRICGLDSAFTSGGDRSVSIEALCGRVEGRKHLHIVAVTILDIDDKKQMAPSHQVVLAWLSRNRLVGIPPKCAGFDNSGAGIAFGHIVDMEWSPQVRKINFGGKPSGRKYNLDGDTVMDFANRVSELWVQPKQYLRAGQITGLTPDIIEELVAREYDQGSDSHKLKVEKKAKLKERTGRSPDLGDAFCIMVDVAIQNGLLDSVEEKAIIGKARSEWKRAVNKFSFRTRKTRMLKF